MTWVYDKKLKRAVKRRAKKYIAPVAPMVIGDLPAYKSPLGTGVIDGRAARREDMKRGNAREVDPSEYAPHYHNERFAKKHGLEWSGKKPDPVPSREPFHDVPPEIRERLMKG